MVNVLSAVGQLDSENIVDARLFVVVSLTCAFVLICQNREIRGIIGHPFGNLGARV